MICQYGITLVTTYGIFVLMSWLALTILPKEFERQPWLFDRKWKRALWTLSCLFFLPGLITIVKLPCFAFGEIKSFIMGRDDKIRRNDRKDNVTDIEGDGNGKGQEKD